MSVISRINSSQHMGSSKKRGIAVELRPVLGTPTALLEGPRSMLQSTLDDYNGSDEFACPWDGCDDSFETKRGVSVHHKLSHGESLTRTERDCAVCGEPFTFYQSTLDQKTCSNSCAAKLRRERAELECEFCGDTYEVKPMRADESRYCSHECYWEDSSHGVNTFQCTNCGDTFERPVSETEEVVNGNRFCTFDCYLEWQNMGVRYGGYDTIYRAVRDGIADQRWEAITQDHRRDECELCSSQESLELHHIIPIMVGGTHGSWNLMTLCRRCHQGRVEHFTRELPGKNFLEIPNAST